MHEKISNKAYNDDDLIRIFATRSKAQVNATLNHYKDVFGNDINKVSILVVLILHSNPYMCPNFLLSTHFCGFLNMSKRYLVHLNCVPNTFGVFVLSANFSLLVIMLVFSSSSAFKIQSFNSSDSFNP